VPEKSHGFVIITSFAGPRKIERGRAWYVSTIILAHLSMLKRRVFLSGSADLKVT